MLTLERKICKEKDRKRGNEYVKNYYYKKTKLLNPFINCVKTLENVSLNKLIFK